MITPIKRYDLIEQLLVHLNADESRCVNIKAQQIMAEGKGLISSEFMNDETIEFGLTQIMRNGKLDSGLIRRAITVGLMAKAGM